MSPKCDARAMACSALALERMRRESLQCSDENYRRKTGSAPSLYDVIPATALPVHMSCFICALLYPKSNLSNCRSGTEAEWRFCSVVPPPLQAAIARVGTVIAGF